MVMIPNGPNSCKLCEENYDIKNYLTKTPTYWKKKQLTKMSCSIGEFQMLHYQPMLKKFFVKNEWNNLIREASFGYH